MVGPDSIGASQPPLTQQQQQALKGLHEAATQFEGVFLQMVMSSMSDTVPKDDIFGKSSSSEQTWQSMLDNERSQEMAKNGGFGLAAELEREYRSQVLAGAAQESKVQVEGRIDP